VKIKLPAHIHAELFKKVGEDWLHKEGPRLLLDFEIGEPCRVGAVFTRTFGTDWWQTSYVEEILEIKRVEEHDKVGVIFRTYSGATYSLVVNARVYDDNVEVLESVEED